MLSPNERAETAEATKAAPKEGVGRRTSKPAVVAPMAAGRAQTLCATKHILQPTGRYFDTSQAVSGVPVNNARNDSRHLHQLNADPAAHCGQNRMSIEDATSAGSPHMCVQ